MTTLILRARCGIRSTQEACASLVGVPLPVGALAHAVAALATLRANPAAAWRLLPFLIVALALPFVLAPLLTGVPKLPEPRCAMMRLFLFLVSCPCALRCQ